MNVQSLIIFFVIGAVIGGFLFGALDISAGGLVGFPIMAVAGATILLLIAGVLKRARATMTYIHSPIMGALGLVVGLAMGLGSGAASADADGPDFYAVRGVASDDVLNIRVKPNPRARKVGEIPPDGACIRNLGCRGGLSFQEFTELSPAERKQRERENPRWCKVQYRGITGWVAGRYLAEDDCPR